MTTIFKYFGRYLKKKIGCGNLESSHRVLILDLLMRFYWRMFAIQVPCKPQTIATTFLANNNNNINNIEKKKIRCPSIKILLRLRTDGCGIWWTDRATAFGS